MKPVAFLGTSLDDIKAFPVEARHKAGYQIGMLQKDKEPTDWKPFKNVGAGVMEIRIHDDSGEFRVIYVAKFDEAIYVLHAFKKKTQKTSGKDIDLAKKDITIF